MKLDSAIILAKITFFFVEKKFYLCKYRQEVLAYARITRAGFSRFRSRYDCLGSRPCCSERPFCHPFGAAAQEREAWVAPDGVHLYLAGRYLHSRHYAGPLNPYRDGRQLDSAVPDFLTGLAGDVHRPYRCL